MNKELVQKAKEAGSAEEFPALARETGGELPDGDLDAVAGGSDIYIPDEFGYCNRCHKYTMIAHNNRLCTFCQDEVKQKIEEGEYESWEDGWTSWDG